jgi:hypothetical protein
MNKYLLTLAIICLAWIPSLAQTLTPRVICSGYGSGQGGGIKLNYTIGETFVTTLRSGNTVLTQGFHQPEVVLCPSAPLVANPAVDITVECDAFVPQYDPGFYMENGTAVTTEVTSSETFDGCTRVITSTYVGTNVCSDTTTVVRTITQVDSTSPVIEAEWTERSFECSDAQIIWPSVTAVDNCFNAELTYAEETIPGDCISNYSIAKTYTAIDACGNSSTLIVTAIVIDSTAPVILNLPDGGALSCLETINYDGIEVIDNCSDATLNVSVTESPTPDGIVAVVDITAIDACGNTSSASVTYNAPLGFAGSPCDDGLICTINDVVDANCGCSGTFIDYNNDNVCDYVESLSITASSLTFCPGDDVTLAVNNPLEGINYFWSNNNSGTAITVNPQVTGDFTVSAIIDNQFVSASIQLEALPQYDFYLDQDGDGLGFGSIIFTACEEFFPGYTLNSLDCDDTNPSIFEGAPCFDGDICTVNDVFNADCVCVGIYVGDDDNDGICNAIDSCAGRPIATLIPADLTLSCEDEIPAFDPGFYMADGSEVFVTQTASVTSDGCSTQIIQVWTGTNDCNESTSVFRTITKNDYFAPVFLSTPADVTIACNAYDNFSPSIPEAIDNCSTPTVSWTTQRIDGDCPMNYTIRYTVDAIDACSNASTIVFNVSVVDQVAPILSDFPADRTVSCEDFADLPVALPSATDNCSSNFNISYTESILPGYCPSNYTVQYTYTALDECGNQTEGSYNVEVIDYTAPIIELPFTGGTVDCITDINERLFTATDNCSEVTLSSSSIEYSDGTHYLVETTYTATDACGNSQIAFVRDTTLLGPIGSPCNDGFFCTANDVVTADCGCSGSLLDADGDFVCDFLEGLTITATALSFCPGETITLTIDQPLPGLTYYWSNNQIGNSIQVTPTQTSTYSVYAIIDGQSVSASIELSALAQYVLYADADGDGFGDPQQSMTACTEELAGYSNNDLDCNDTSDMVYPGAPCTDNDPCTIGDKITDDCSCVGMLSLPAVGEVTAFACGSYSWNGSVYTASGDYDYYTPAASGCDSLTILHLTVGQPTFSTQQITNCNSYQWNGAVYTQSGTYTYVTTNSSGCPNTATLNLTINTSSTAPTAAVASASSVSAGTAVTLSVSGGSLGTGAQWRWYRSSCGGTFLGTGASITVAPSATETYFVRAEGTCNTTACASVTVNVLSGQCGPEAVSASAMRICQGSSTTLSVVGTLYPGAIWRWRKNSCTGTIVGTGASLSVSPTTNTTYYVRAEGGTCGVTVCLEITIIVDKLPSTPSVISGQVSGLCNAQNVTYSVTPVSTVQQYNWTVPPGITIVSGQGTASVTVNVSNFINTNPTNGNPAICVTAQNACGNSPIRCLSLTTFPATPASISGPAQPCINTVNTYSCPAVYGASSYTWLVPTGWVIQSGQGTSSITVLCNGTGGSVRVRTANACGTSGLKSMTVAPKACSTSAMPMQLELWPNPTSDRVFFAHGDAQPEHMQIYDMLGRDIYNGGWLPEFDVSGLASGIYFVRATSGGESVVKRMEVVR